ncbi:MAG TPA: tRNA lysidine(34) synthetase TilS [Alphaproteobacteria bacterium]|nr:tRNA lysidine(34) synthetase TilS [Alphaproteobacteria bacterium]
MRSSSTGQPKHASNLPVSEAGLEHEFTAALAALAPRHPLAVAVSGGPDSTAALALATQYALDHQHPAPMALIVDHGLRAESAAEAAMAAEQARAAGLTAHVLVWEGTKPAANVQALARAARYRLIAEQMQTLGLRDLITGHTADDQVETFLLRLGRGSGLKGLAGIAPTGPFPLAGYTGLRVLRPLLGVRKAQLVQHCEALGLRTVNDPSNENTAFARVQAREIMSTLGTLGLTHGRLLATIGHLQRASAAIEAAVEQLLRQAVRFEPFGFAKISLSLVQTAPEEVALRVLANGLRAVSGEPYGAEFDDLGRLWHEVRASVAYPARTLSGCLVGRDNGLLWVAREPAAAASTSVDIQPGQSAVWDGRFVVALGASYEPGRYRVAADRRPIRRADLGAYPAIKGQLATLVPSGFPALWRGEQCLGPAALTPGQGLHARFLPLQEAGTAS